MIGGLVYLRPARMVFVRATGPYETSIPHAWEKMFAWLEKSGIDNPVGRGFGLARDNPATVGPQNCRYDACVEVKPQYEERAGRELGLMTLPGGSYLSNRGLMTPSPIFEPGFEYVVLSMLLAIGPAPLPSLNMM